MVNLLKRFIEWLKSFTRPHAAALGEDTAREIAATVERVKRTPKSTQEIGPLYYMGGLLDNLDKFFEDFDFLRRNDPEMATVFSNIGCTIGNDRQLFSPEIQPTFKKHLPSMGCVYMGRGGDSKKKGRINCRFVYFQKLHQPINVQPTNGSTYAITTIYDDKVLKISKYHIAVLPDGSVKVLKEGRVRTHTVGKNRSTRSTFHRFEWSFPWIAEELQRNWNHGRAEKATLDEAAGAMAAILFNCSANAEMGVNVRVRKGGRTATFAINMLRTPYFFADRQKTVNVNGKTEKILHFVRPHVRVSAAGVPRTIKGHWRGVRSFTWNGYDVTIGMPGKHVMPLMLNLNMAGYDEADMERLGEQGVGVDEFSKIVADNIDLTTKARM